MCQFLSLVSDGKGKMFYFGYAIRKDIIAGKLKYESTDSHTSICDYFKLKEDVMNKYEFNPLTKEFTVDQINNKRDDRKSVEKQCNKLNFKKIVPELIIKEIINPLKIQPPEKITKEHINLLKEWASVWASISASVRDSISDSVWDSVSASVRASIWASIWDSVRASIWASVWDSVWDSVRASVRDSIWDSISASIIASIRASRDSIWDSIWDLIWASISASVRAYISTFFNIKYKYDFSSTVKLWEMGLVPSYDGKIWRLHGGENAKILWEGKI